jgi:hypothetical protein
MVFWGASSLETDPINSRKKLEVYLKQSASTQLTSGLFSADNLFNNVPGFIGG